MREMEYVSRYALSVLGVRPNYIAGLREFQKAIDPKTRCYEAYMHVLDELAEYAAKLERQQQQQQQQQQRTP